MQRSLAAGLIATALALSALPSFAQDAQTAAKPAHRPMPKPSNLQVLPKDISSPDLIAAMRSYSKALGVECEFCHSEDPQTHRPNFASDAKEDKGIARIMISMTQEINQKYLSTVKDPDATPADKTVTCGTCHRGNTMPAQFFGAAPGWEMHHEGEAPPAKSE